MLLNMRWDLKRLRWVVFEKKQPTTINLKLGVSAAEFTSGLQRALRTLSNPAADAIVADLERHPWRTGWQPDPGGP